jgi:RNA polymerase sigma factor (sigma-70 family)
MHATAPLQELTPALRGRLRALWERTGHAALGRLADGKVPYDGAAFDSKQDRSDWISTCLMDAFKATGDAGVFALLFECNERAFLLALHTQLRRTRTHVDAADVLQEAFLNIYRYPHRFHPDRADAFRNWGHRIVRNTALKFLRGEGRLSRQQSLEDEFQCEDVRARTPLRAADEHEGAELVDRAYLLYLNLYLLHFGKLSPKEQRALTMVEIEDRPYRDAAAELGIRLENLKMVIFRGRQKIFRGMSQTLAAMAAADDAQNSKQSPRSLVVRSNAESNARAVSDARIDAAPAQLEASS